MGQGKLVIFRGVKYNCLDSLIFYRTCNTDKTPLRQNPPRETIPCSK